MTSAEAQNLITTTLARAALNRAPPPFALVDGEVRRVRGYVVACRFVLPSAGDDFDKHSICAISNRRFVFSRPCAEALMRLMLDDLKRGGQIFYKRAKQMPLQVILAQYYSPKLSMDAREYTPIKYASGPRWIPTKERPVDETF